MLDSSFSIVITFTYVKVTASSYTLRGEMSMYQGTNVKAIQSQKWLADALVALMCEADYRSITIKDICRRADLSRQTFYNVFDSKDEILHFYLQCTYRDSLNELKQHGTLTAEDVVRTFIGVVEQNLKMLNTMVKNHLMGILAEEIVSGVDLFTDAFVADDQRDEVFPYSKAMLSGAFSQVLIFWLSQPEPIDISELAVLLTEFLKGNVYTLSTKEKNHDL